MRSATCASLVFGGSSRRASMTLAVSWKLNRPLRPSVAKPSGARSRDRRRDADRGRAVAESDRRRVRRCVFSGEGKRRGNWANARAQPEKSLMADEGKRPGGARQKGSEASGRLGDIPPRVEHVASVTFLTSRARGSHQRSPRARARAADAIKLLDNKCYCFCILGAPAERLKGIQQGGRRTRAGSGRPQCPWSGHLNCSIAVAHRRRSDALSNSRSRPGAVFGVTC